jgi:hypothetical protein
VVWPAPIARCRPDHHRNSVAQGLRVWKRIRLVGFGFRFDRSGIWWNCHAVARTQVEPIETMVRYEAGAAGYTRAAQDGTYIEAVPPRLPLGPGSSWRISTHNPRPPIAALDAGATAPASALLSRTGLIHPLDFHMTQRSQSRVD